MSRQISLRSLRAAQLGLILALLIAALALPSSAFAATTATIREELNLRRGPGTGYAIITTMPAGARITLAGEASEGWYPVQYNDLKGWAYAAYIAVGEAAPSESGGHGTATVVTALLNLRSGPGLRYDVVTELPYGTTVDILGEPKAADGRAWLEVMASRAGRGWVAREYLDAGETTGPQAAVSVPAPAAPARSGDAIVDLITDAANRYGQSPSAMLAVARCESGLNPNAVNRSSGASGLFQFLPGTWRTTPYASSSIFDPWANANAAAWMWSVGRRGEWVC